MPKKTKAQLDQEIRSALTNSAGADARSRPWQGTNANEGSINRVRNALVSIYLDGVAGVSPVIGEHGWKQIEPDKADAYLKKGREVLQDLVAQRAPRSAKSWQDHEVKKLRGLIEKAQAVRDGAHQKMTAESYAELRRSLGMR